MQHLETSLFRKLSFVPSIERKPTLTVNQSFCVQLYSWLQITDTLYKVLNMQTFKGTASVVALL